MQNVAAGGNFAHLRLVRECLHADYALSRAELIELFVILSVLKDGNKLLVLVNDRLVLDASQSLLFVSSTSALFSQLSNRSVSSVCLLTDCSVNCCHIDLVLLHASAASALQTKHHGAASDA